MATTPEARPPERPSNVSLFPIRSEAATEAVKIMAPEAKPDYFAMGLGIHVQDSILFDFIHSTKKNIVDEEGQYAYRRGAYLMYKILEIQSEQSKQSVPEVSESVRENFIEHQRQEHEKFDSQGKNAFEVQFDELMLEETAMSEALQPILKVESNKWFHTGLTQTYLLMRKAYETEKLRNDMEPLPEEK